MSPVEFLSRVFVHVARSTGQSVRSVVRQRADLTMWTYMILMDLEREATVRALGDRVDLAGMVALAFHKPSELRTQETRYLREAGLLKAVIDTARERGLRMVEAHRHAVVVPPMATE